jgi:ferredoxin-type protein NapH
MFIFLMLIVLLGNAFCGWACPIGTLVDSFDKGIEIFLPKVEAKRNERSLQRRQSKHNNDGHEDHGKHLVCPSCPVSKVISNRNGVVAYGILGLALVGSATLRFNVFCSVCPMGILTRGMLHLKAVLYIAKGVTAATFLYVTELLVFPVAAVLVSIRERRFWCKKLCPLGALLNGAGALNPFIKPRVKEEKCVLKGCPDECEDYHGDYCGICRLEDEKKCEKVCPVDINLVDHEPLHRCTKCMECYIACDRNAVSVDLLGKPEVFRIGGFFRRLMARQRKDHVKPIKNPRNVVNNSARVSDA